MARVQMREPEAEEQVAPETSDERDTPEPAAESRGGVGCAGGDVALRG